MLSFEINKQGSVQYFAPQMAFVTDIFLVPFSDDGVVLQVLLLGVRMHPSGFATVK